MHHDALCGLASVRARLTAVKETLPLVAMIDGGRTRFLVNALYHFARALEPRGARMCILCKNLACATTSLPCMSYSLAGVAMPRCTWLWFAMAVVKDATLDRGRWKQRVRSPLSRSRPRGRLCTNHKRDLTFERGHDFTDGACSAFEDNWASRSCGA